MNTLSKYLFSISLIFIGNFLLAQDPCGADALFNASPSAPCADEESNLLVISPTLTITNIDWQWTFSCGGGFCSIPPVFLSDQTAEAATFDSSQFPANSDPYAMEMRALVTHTTGSCVTSSSAFLVKPLPTFSILDDFIEICPGTQGTLQMVSESASGGLDPNCASCTFEWKDQFETTVLVEDTILNVYPTSTTTYAAVATLEGCSAKLFGTINPNGPNPGNISGLVANNIEYCSGENIDIFSENDGTDGCSDYSWRIDGTTQVGETNATLNDVDLPNVAAITEIEFIRTLSCELDGTTCSSNDTLVLNINPTPTISTGTDDEVYCSGDFVSTTGFTVLPNGTANWFEINNTLETIGATNNTGTGDISSFTASNNTAGVIQAHIQATPVLNGCAGDSVVVRMSVLPAVSLDAQDDVSACAGSNIVANFEGVFSEVNWTNNNTGVGLGATGSGAINFTAAEITGAPVYSNIVANPSFVALGRTCTGQSDQFSIEIIPNAALSVSDQFACDGSMINMAPTGTFTSFSWTSSNDAIVGLAENGNGNISFMANPTGTESEGATITFTSDNSGCPGPTATAQLGVYPLPTLADLDDLNLCTDVEVTISPEGTYDSLTWTSDNAAIGFPANGSPTPIVYSPAAIGQGNIVMTPTNPACSGDAVSFVIDVLESPNIASPSVLACSGMAQAILPTGTFTNFTWTSENVPGLAATGNGNINFTPTYTGENPAEGIVTLLPQNPGCTGNPVEVAVQTYATPFVNAIAASEYCVGQAVEKTPTGIFDVANWTNDNVSIGESQATGAGPLDFVAANPTPNDLTATFTYTPSNAGCGAGPTTTVEITVTAQPTFVENLPDVDACAGNQVNISPAGFYDTYSWENSNIAIGLNSAGNGTIDFTSENNTAAVISATVTATPFNGTCSGEPRVFEINIFPTATFAGNDANLCNNVEEYELDPLWNNVGDFSWNDNLPLDTIETQADGTLVLEIPPSAAGQDYSFTISGSIEGSNCTNTETFVVSVYATPVAEIIASSADEVCSNEVTVLSADGADSYLWNCENCNLASAEDAQTTATWLNNDGSQVPTSSTISATVDLTESITYNDISLTCIDMVSTPFEISDFIMPTSSGIIQSSIGGLLIVSSPDAQFFQWGTLDENGIQTPIPSAITGNYFSNGEPCEELPYYVTLSIYDDFTCPLTLNTCENIVGIEDEQFVAFSLRPNPTAGNRVLLDLDKSLTQQKIDLVLMSASGETILSQQFQGQQNTLELNLPEFLSPGIYFLRIDANSKTFYTRLIKS